MSIVSDRNMPPGTSGVLLIHGLTGTPNEMRFVARGLERRGFTVRCVQLAGHCGTQADLLKTGWRDWVASVEKAAHELKNEVDHMFVAGLSMGAVLALKYAIEHPQHVSGLGLYGTTFFYDGWSIPFKARFAFLFPLTQWLGIGRKRVFVETFPYGIKNERLRRSISQKMLAGDSQAAGLMGNPWPALAEFYALSANVQRKLKQLSTPSLIMHALEDDVSSLRNVKLLEKRVDAPIEKVILKNSYHMITVDQERDQVIEKSADFFHRLASVCGGAKPLST